MINDTMDRSHKQLGELAVMQSKVNESEKLILLRAEARLDEVNARIQVLRPKSLRRSREYLGLIAERGQLHRVIARAKACIQ